MGDVPAWLALVFGAVLMWLWLLIGAGVVAIFRPDLREDTFAALFNTLIWPLGAVMQTIVWPLVKRRRERERQARITEKVQRGEYTATFARDILKWKGE